MPALLTASEIARAAGVSRQAVSRALAGVRSDAAKIVQGVDVKAWGLEQLPARLAEAIKQTPAQAWAPKIPLAEIAQPCIDKALRLRAALSRTLERRKDNSIAAADLERIGCEEFKSMCGYAISERHFRRVVARVVERDGGREDWQRIELYLGEDIYRAGGKPPKAADEWQQNLLDEIAHFKNPSAPSNEDRRYFWDELFYTSEQMVSAGRVEKQAKRLLMDFVLKHAPWLAANRTALHVAWHRAHARWLSGGKTVAALDDRRTEKSGYFRAPALKDSDRMQLIAMSAKFQSGDKGWEFSKPKLDAELLAYYSTSPGIPRRVWDKIKHDKALAEIGLHGPKTVRVAGAFVDRDPSGSASGDWDQSDDMTFINVMYEETPYGLYLGQPQFLLFLDERSWMGFTWDLISEKSYNQFSIRNSWALKADDWGLPRKGFAFERGLWAKSKLLVGRRVEGIYPQVHKRGDEVDVADTERGLRRFGLRFHHYTEARGKVIESVYRLLQQYLQALPGYVGRNPLTDRYEEVQKQIRLVASGKAPPSKYFLSKAEWMDRLREVLLHYNKTNLGGKYHRDSSPLAVYEKNFTSKLVQIPPEQKSILASHKVIIHRVGGNGISFKFGERKFIYKSLELGARIGQAAIAHFQCEKPETLVVTDGDGLNPLVVSRSTSVYPHDPLPGTLEKALKENADQNHYRKDLHRSLKPYYRSEFFQNLFRPTITDPATVEIAQEIKRQTDELTAAQRQREKVRSKARKVARALDWELPGSIEDRPGDVEAAERVQNFLAAESEDK